MTAQPSSPRSPTPRTSSPPRARSSPRLYDGVGEAIVVIDVVAEGEYRFVAMNERMAKLVGVASLSGSCRIEEIAPPDSAARIIARCTEAIRSGRPVQWQAVTTYPSGVIHVDVTLTPLLESDGSCRRLVGLVRDQTELARREEARLAAERQAEMQYRSFNLAVAALSDVVYVFDREGRFTYASPPLLNLLGRSHGDVIGKTVRDLDYPPATADQVLRDVDRVVTTGEPLRGETPFTDVHGEEGYYEYSFHPVLDGDGRVHAVAGSSRDVSERKRVEQQLLAHAEEQRALAEALEIEHERLTRAQSVARIGSWIFDFETQTVTWSDETYRICGLSKADDPHLYEALRKRVHPDDLATFDRAAVESTAGMPYVFDHRLLMPDGSVRWVQERCEFVRAEDGTLLRAIGTMQDITDRKAAEAALQQSQQLLRIASAIGHVGGWQVDLTTLTVSWSDEVCAIHGVPAGFQPRIEAAIDFYLPEDRPLVQGAVGACIATGDPFDFEARLVNTRGEIVWVRAIGEAAVDHLGVVTGIHGAFQDISRIKQVLDALRASDERFRLVAQATSDVVWDYDLLQDTVWWSEGMRTQFGHDTANGTHVGFWVEQIHPDDRPRVAKGFDDALRSARLWREEYRLRKADGSYAQVIDRAFIVRGTDGRVHRAVGAIVDVTQQRALEAQLQQIQRVASLGQLAANMAHEFNNVLMGIQPFAEIIRRVTEHIAMAQDGTRHIMQAVRRGQKVTEEILRFTRRIEPTLRPIEAGEWLRSFHAEAVALVGDTLQVVLRLPDEPLHLQGDMAQLNQVLANLVINARDASTPGSRVVIGARLTDEYVIAGGELGVIDVTVQDYGAGMDASTIERIFEPLFTTKPSGTGLGLAISTQVIRAHGGTMHVVSEQGKGTTFHLLLPVGHGSAAASVIASGAVEEPPTRALIVEDDAAVAAGITMLLDCEQVATSGVSTGRQAIAAIEHCSPDLVFLDIGLPDVSGVDVFQQIHDRWPQLRVVLMTGHYSPTELQSILSLPHVAFLQKPFGAEEIRNVLKLTNELARERSEGPTAGAAA
ncbi:MAG TPA: PAS domain-containing protein [Thermoanaerobaculia bacterium]|nr:PAS domain-containing protein [Thermoanaerobaculia bacterium]